MMRSFVGILMAVILFLNLCPQGLAQDKEGDCYPDAPDLVLAKVDQAAKFIAQKGPVPAGADVGLNGFFKELFLYTVIDAITPPTDPASADAASIRTLKAYRYIAETSRTDKQVGASARAGGTTTVAEKPGIIDLLGFAIEHGGIQQETNDTTLTLSTSPYALIAAANGDTAETYKTYEFFTRIGLSASFNIATQDPVLANATRQQLKEWAVKFRIFGDQSFRSDKFVKFWNEKIRPKILRRLNVVKGGEILVGQNSTLLARRSLIVDPATPGDAESARLSLNDKIAAYINSNQSKTPDERAADIKQMILCHLYEFIVQPIRNNELPLDSTFRMKLQEGIVPSLITANQELENARKTLNEFLKDFQSGPQATAAYYNERGSDGQNYQVFKLLYQQDAFRPMKMTANLAVSIYNQPNPLLRQQRVRDVAAALSFEGTTDKTFSPFTTNKGDMSKITYSFTGRYQRMFENQYFPGRKADIGTFQFRLEIPFLEGMSLPLSVSYSNATEQSRKDGVRFNFGFLLNADKLSALQKLK